LCDCNDILRSASRGSVTKQRFSSCTALCFALHMVVGTLGSSCKRFPSCQFAAIIKLCSFWNFVIVTSLDEALLNASGTRVSLSRIGKPVGRFLRNPFSPSQTLRGRKVKICVSPPRTSSCRPLPACLILLEDCPHRDIYIAVPRVRDHPLLLTEINV
jgi:hypothetical protein